MGTLAGRALDFVYHAGLRTSDGKVQISRTADGTSWTTVAAFTPVAGSYNNAPVIRQCPDTGALFLHMYVTSTNIGEIRMSLDQGATWTEPVRWGGTMSAGQLGAAGGRLFLTDVSGAVYVSDGIGWE